MKLSDVYALLSFACFLAFAYFLCVYLMFVVCGVAFGLLSYGAFKHEVRK